jgi:transposase
VRSVAAARRHDLTDVRWAALQPFLSAGTGRDRPRRWAMRAIVDGIRWRVRTGSPWRDVPAVYPPWQTLYRWFRRWQRDGVWAQILALLQARGDAAGSMGWTVSVDSTISRAHQHAAGARRDGDLQKESPGGAQAEPADHGLGRSRGGWTTKTHLACEQGRKVMAVVVTAGQRGDSQQFIPVRAKRFGQLGVAAPHLVLIEANVTIRNFQAFRDGRSTFADTRSGHVARKVSPGPWTSTTPAPRSSPCGTCRVEFYCDRIDPAE